MKKMLIITNEQFGYHTDTYKYAEKMNKEYNIYFLCLDYNYTKIKMNNISFIYVRKSNNNKINNIKLLLYAIISILKYRIDIVFTMYFRLCNIIPIIFKNRKHNLDIRTGIISENIEIVKKGNKNIARACKSFKNISIISEGLIDYLKIEKRNKNIRILPLGADIDSTIRNKKNKDSITFGYIGVLNDRNINDTLKSFIKFSNELDSGEFLIVGYHSKNNSEKEEFYQLIKSNDRIKFLGRVQHNKINEILSRIDVGISYVPKKDYYNFQPPTKTYEYLAYGIPCIATSTNENKKIISSFNGILCEDNIEDLFEKMKYINLNINKYNSEIIKKSIRNNSWEYICNNIFKDIIENLK